MLDEVPFTADDLPGYAGRLFDFLIANPHQLRPATWNRLERAVALGVITLLAVGFGEAHQTAGRRQIDDTIVPAVIQLLGRSAWWLPSWLRRALPKVELEHH
ncbi:hypothetical protein [Streptomyces sp. NPDC059909]|uniref:hypothetical protein n=1 Tax=Streptomyces sp. NPDC059909 TaxID=3346998 RepID=UPI00365B8E4C